MFVSTVCLLPAYPLLTNVCHSSAHIACIVPIAPALGPLLPPLQGSPIYAPKAVRFRLGGVACFTPDGTPLPPAQLVAAARHDMHTRPPAPAPAAVGGAGGGAGGGTAAADGDAGSGSTQAQHAQQAGAGGQQQQAAGVLPRSPQQQQHQQQQQQRGEGERWVWESPVYEVESVDALQRFPIPPTLCVGGYLRVELLGKRQRQSVDDQFYGE